MVGLAKNRKLKQPGNEKDFKMKLQKWRRHKNENDAKNEEDVIDVQHRGILSYDKQTDGRTKKKHL